MPDTDSGTEQVSVPAASEGTRTLLFESPKTVALSLAAGESVPPHRHPDSDIVLLVRSGELDLRLGESTHRVTAGDAIRFDGDRDISPEAVTDSEAVLVLA
jgi:quercetin dioxygenase-like cupin family protein